jgi:hypothetical protein
MKTTPSVIKQNSKMAYGFAKRTLSAQARL